MRLLGVILHQGLYIVMEHVSKVGVGPDVGSGLGGAPEQPRAPQAHFPSPQGNLVNFLRTRGRALVSTPQLLQFSL